MVLATTTAMVFVDAAATDLEAREPILGFGKKKLPTAEEVSYCEEDCVCCFARYFFLGRN